jgi:hypothetical protein
MSIEEMPAQRTILGVECKYWPRSLCYRGNEGIHEIAAYGTWFPKEQRYTEWTVRLRLYNSREDGRSRSRDVYFDGTGETIELAEERCRDHMHDVACELIGRAEAGRV